MVGIPARNHGREFAAVARYADGHADSLSDGHFDSHTDNLSGGHFDGHTDAHAHAASRTGAVRPDDKERRRTGLGRDAGRGALRALDVVGKRYRLAAS